MEELENKIDKDLKSLINEVKKKHGKESILLADGKPMDVPTISTGSVALDIAVGIGGLPKGRITEIYGPQSSGKTTLAIHTIAEAQKTGEIAAFIDVEHSFDRHYAEALGVDTSKLLISQPDYGEHALDIVEQLVRSGKVGIVVVDSVAALVPKTELEGEMGDQKMALQARMMSQAMRKLTPAISRSSCVCIFINQLREKVGIMFGNPEVTSGGNALKFYASIRLDIRKTGSAVKDKEGNVIANHVKVKVVKNKLAPPFTIANFDIVYGEGISKVGEIIDIGVELGVIEKAGSWYSYDGIKIAQGRESAKQFFEDNPETAVAVKEQILNHFKNEE